MILNKRVSGILCPIFSLPNNEGIGTLGHSAFAFVDFLADTKQRYWQILPIGPTSYGDSPYQSYSSYAGNPYFIDLELLKNQGLLTQNDLNTEWNNTSYIDYDFLSVEKYKILRLAFRNIKFTDSYRDQAYTKLPWLKDYATFMALKSYYHENPRHQWPDSKIKVQLTKDFQNQIQKEEQFHIFLQITFYEQWSKLKQYANSKDVLIIGDLPIFVASDSVEVWSNPEYFKLDEKGNQTVSAGVPPDYFSSTGQLWGNPLYNWDKIQKDNFTWWISRIKYSLQLFDVLRIDHFRAFESYWEIPANEESAINGNWIKAPGKDFFDSLKKSLGAVPLIAEDLGIITDEVKDLMNYVGFPGMSVLQFAFDNDEKNPYKPHNISENKVIYTGTHDNNTTVGWYLDGENVSSVQNALRYMQIDTDSSNLDADIFCRKFIEMAFNTKANTVITPIQDILCLGEEARINIPSTLGNNWNWRMQVLPDESIRQWLLSFTKITHRG